MDAHIGSYIFYEDLYRSDRITTYVVPFVIGMLLARDSIVGISIPMIESQVSNIPTDKGNYVCCHKGSTDKDLRRICRNQSGHPGPAIGY